MIVWILKRTIYVYCHIGLSVFFSVFMYLTSLVTMCTLKQKRQYSNLFVYLRWCIINGILCLDREQVMLYGLLTPCADSQDAVYSIELRSWTVVQGMVIALLCGSNAIASGKHSKKFKVICEEARQKRVLWKELEGQTHRQMTVRQQRPSGRQW